MQATGACLLGLAGLALAAAFQGKPAATFDPPVRLKAGDAFIDTGADIAYSGPQVFDLDGDGKKDLLVGTFRGHVQVFRNVGTNEARVFEAKGNLEADGKVVEIPNW
jgi:hypothetical protein